MSVTFASTQGQPSFVGRAKWLVLAALVAGLALIGVVGPVATARAETFPPPPTTWTSLNDRGYSNNHWSDFAGLSSTMYRNWAKPSQTTNDFSCALNVVTLNATTYVISMNQDKTISCTPYAIPVDGSDPSHDTSNGLTSVQVLASGDYDYYLGAGLSGGPYPAIVVFYESKNDPGTTVRFKSVSLTSGTSAQSPGTLTVGSQGSGTIWDRSWFSFNDRNCMEGKILGLNGGFAFVFNDSTQNKVRVFTTDLVGTPSGNWPTQALTTTTLALPAGTPAADSIRSVDACLVNKSDNMLVAVGYLYGDQGTTPTQGGSQGANGSTDWSAFGKWDNMQGQVAILNYTNDSSGDPQVAVTSQKPLPWPAAIPGGQGTSIGSDSLFSSPVGGQVSSLQSGQCLVSQNGWFELVMQNDGNLVIYDVNGDATWASGSSGKGTGPYSLAMQSDGNLCLRDSGGQITWATNSYGKGSGTYSLGIQNDGNLCLRDSGDGQITWATGTYITSLVGSFGLRDIQMVQGSLDGGQTGDCVQALVRGGGISTHASSGLKQMTKVDVFTFGDLYANTITLDPNDDTKITAVNQHRAEDSWGTYWGATWSDDSWYPISACVSTNFFAFPASSFTSSGVLDRQYMAWMNTATLAFQKGSYGSVGSWGTIASDRWVPSTDSTLPSTLPPLTQTTVADSGNAVKRQSQSAAGGRPATDAPLAVVNTGPDPTAYNPIGVIFGPPPVAKNGVPDNTWALYSATQLSFASESGAGLTNYTGVEEDNSLGVGASVSRTYAKWPAISQSASISMGWTWGHSFGSSGESSSQTSWSQAFQKTQQAQNGYAEVIYATSPAKLTWYTKQDWSSDYVPASLVNVASPQSPSCSTYNFDMTSPQSPDFTTGWGTANNPIDPGVFASKVTSISSGLPTHAGTFDPTDPQWLIDPQNRTTSSGTLLAQATLNGSVANTGQSSSTLALSNGSARSDAHTMGWTIGSDFIVQYRHNFTETWGSQTTTTTSEGITGSIALLKPIATPTPGPNPSAPGSSAPPLSSLTVEMDWMQATDGGAYWISDAQRQTGSTPLPWCIDYQVLGWEPYTLTTTGVAFADLTHGWAVNNEGHVRATTDGGASWTVQSFGLEGGNTNQAYTDVAAVDDTHAWAVGRYGTIAATSDGTNWGSRTSGTAQNLWGVTFADDTKGWAVGAGGTILATTSGGSSWTAQTSTTTNSLFGVARSDASHAWAVGAGGTILATTNGGSSWTAQTSTTTNRLSGVAFADATHGWAVGSGGTILATSNGGTTWKAQKSGTTVDLARIAFANDTHGLAVGDGGTILATSNGGTTWAARSSGIVQPLCGVASNPDGLHAWATGAATTWGVGTDDVILGTTDGGATWDSQIQGSASRAAALMASRGGGANGCRVAVSARPAGWGTAAILGSDPAEGGRVATVGAAGTTIVAKPADGYRFVRWTSVGTGQAKQIADPKAARTTISVSGNGLDTVRAWFARAVPRKFRITRLGSGSCNISLGKAQLPRALASAARLKASRVALVFGERTFTIPKGKWSRQGGTYVASLTPRIWKQRAGSYRLSVDPGHRTWSLSVTGARFAAALLRRCAGGQAPVGLSVNGKTAGAFGFPIALRATLVPTPPLRIKTTTKPLPVVSLVSLSAATVKCALLSTKKLSAARYTLQGAKVSKKLFARQGFLLALNGQSFPVGPFHKQSGVWVYTGRTKAGIALTCRYDATHGRLALQLGGRALPPVLSELVAQNITLAVTTGTQQAADNMITRVKTLAAVKLAPGLAR